ncbi:MAG: hypothetical protein Q9204_004468 [Flavoplaca sp. TL-2023a]
MSETAAINCNPRFNSTAELLTSKRITIHVGPDNVPFDVHHDVLCERSAHFRAALQSPFTEAHSDRIAFPDQQPYTIKLFPHWVYTLHLPARQYPTDLQPYTWIKSITVTSQGQDLDSILVTHARKPQSAA